MFEKAGKFYADWRDRSGKRMRRSFKSQRAALQYEAEQKALAHPKHKAQGTPSPRYSAPKFQIGSGGAQTTQKRQSSSSKPLAKPARTNSQPPKSPKRSTSTKLVPISTARK
jgi:hypothetical protein